MVFQDITVTAVSRSSRLRGVVFLPRATILSAGGHDSLMQEAPGSAFAIGKSGIRCSSSSVVFLDKAPANSLLYRLQQYSLNLNGF